MYINIADVQVSVYKLELPQKMVKFSSFKLSNLKYIDLENLPNASFRPGIKDILSQYANLQTSKSTKTLVFNSELNTKIFALAKQPVE
jgi:hypothetical protein